MAGACVEAYMVFSMTILVCAFVAVLIVALFRLALSDDEYAGATAVAALLVFTWLLSLTMVHFTVAKHHEVFTATAAYRAVLVIFLENLSNSNQYTCR